MNNRFYTYDVINVLYFCFRFPTDQNLKDKWLNAIPKSFKYTFYPHATLCSRHFNPKDIYPTKYYDVYTLDNDAVPYIFEEQNSGFSSHEMNLQSSTSSAASNTNIGFVNNQANGSTAAESLKNDP